MEQCALLINNTYCINGGEVMNTGSFLSQTKDFCAVCVVAAIIVVSVISVGILLWVSAL